jgi:hypothetical protein
VLRQISFEHNVRCLIASIDFQKCFFVFPGAVPPWIFWRSFASAGNIVAADYRTLRCSQMAARDVFRDDECDKRSLAGPFPELRFDSRLLARQKSMPSVHDLAFVL